jgi:hypothetical protein
MTPSSARPRLLLDSATQCAQDEMGVSAAFTILHHYACKPKATLPSQLIGATDRVPTATRLAYGSRPTTIRPVWVTAAGWSAQQERRSANGPPLVSRPARLLDSGLAGSRSRDLLCRVLEERASEMRATCLPRGWSITFTLDFRRRVGGLIERRTRQQVPRACEPYRTQEGV